MSEALDLQPIRVNLAEVEQRWQDPTEDVYGLLSAAGRLIDDCKSLLGEVDRLTAQADEVYRSGYRTGHMHGKNKGRMEAIGELTT